MNRKLAVSIVILFGIALGTSAQRRPESPSAPSKPTAARLVVQGTYQEVFTGKTNEGNAEGNLVIKFEAARWVKMSTNEVGNAEFSELEGAPAPNVNGTVTYVGRVKSSSGGDSYEATSNFTGALGGDDVVVTNPEYTDVGNSFKIRVMLNPKLKGKCSTVAVSKGETGTSGECNNGTYFFTASSPMSFDENDDPAKTADTANVANFGLELDIEPDPAAARNAGTGTPVDEAASVRRESDKTMAQGPAGDFGDYVWRGAVTNGSKETGFKILLTKTKELPSGGNRGKITRTLTFTATITPGIPK